MSDDAKAALRRWIVARGRIGEQALSDETPLLAERVLTSLEVPELLLFLEELRGAPIDLEGLSGAALRDVATIHRRFLVPHG
jgi:hypothetical protein